MNLCLGFFHPRMLQLRDRIVAERRGRLRSGGRRSNENVLSNFQGNIWQSENIG